MSVNPRVTIVTTTKTYTYDNNRLTRDTQNAYVTQLTDGTLTQNRSYNNYGELTEQSDNSFTYQLSQRDNAGAITQKRETLNGVTTVYDYTFDDMGRLTNVNKDNQEVETYTYDANGNRATATINGVTTSASYTLDDQLQVYGDNTYRYDDDGYLQEKITPEGTTTYTYGTQGELKEVQTPTQTITYEHNANNQRVAKKVNSTVVEKYLWANLTTLLATYDANDNVKQRFEYADQRMPVSMTHNGTKYYLHYDQVGSLRVVSDTSGNIVKEISYDTYGNIVSDSDEAFKVPFGFAGGLYDSDTKLTRFGYRDYDATTGKWTAKDPIDFEGGDSNLYGYVLQDPVNLIDPTGEFWNFAIGIGLGAGLDLFIQLANNGWNIDCVNWTNVAISGALGAGGVWAGGTKGAGKEFSHWIPRRFLPNSLKKSKSPWLGNYVTPKRHFKHDNYRYPRGWREMGNRFTRPIQQLDRIPNAGKGVGAGGALGFDNSNCECQ